MSTIDFKPLIDSVEEITQSLNAERCNNEDLQHRIREILRELDSGVEKMLSDRDAPMKQAAIEKIHQTAVKLWNATVAKQSGKLIPTKTNCQLRQLCFNMVCATDVVDENFVDVNNDNKRIITMGLKVGKAWLDTAEHDNALSTLKKTEAKIRGLLQSAREKDCVVRTPCEKMDLEKDLFTVLCTEAEVMISCERLKDAENCVEEASKAPFLAETPPGRHNSTEIAKLCSLTFNCGLSLSNTMKYADAVRWLQKSYEVGQCGKDIKKSTLGKILRLTAHCFAELRTAQDDRNAMDTLQTAERYGSHTAGYLLKLKILARNSDVPNEEIDPVVKEFLALGETTIDLGLACCRYFNDNGRLVLCERVMDTLAEKHSNSPQVPRVYSKRFEYNMERLEPAEAIQYTREFLRGTDIIRRLDQQSRMCIQLILWKRAEVCEEKGNKDALLTWCDLSLKFYRLCGQAAGNTPDVTTNIAKLLRNRTSCLLSLGRIEEASESATEASKLQPDNPRSDFALFTVALHQGNEKEAITRIDRVAKASERSENSDTPIHGLVCRCAQIAFEKERFPVALKALDAVQKTTSNRSAKVLALKCVIRLVLGQAGDATSVTDVPEENAILVRACDVAQEALKVLEDISKNPLNEAEVESRRETAVSSQTDQDGCTKEMIGDEADWFMKICWNLAIEAQTFPRVMRKVFHFCYRFLCLLQEDNAVLTRQKTCLLMSCAASLDIARKSESCNDMETYIRFALEQISLHKSISSRLAAFQVQSTVRTEKEVLLRSLYELEVVLKLNPFEPSPTATFPVLAKYKAIENLVKGVTQLPQATVNTLETVAALCLEAPASHARLCKTVLREAISRVLGRAQGGGDNELSAQLASRISMFYRTLIDLTLKQARGADGLGNDEALTLLREALHLAGNTLKNLCPEQELLWFTINGWNVGARLYVAEYIDEAEKWLSTSMRFLVHLPTYKAGYENHMNETYMEILAKKDSIAKKAKSS